MAVYAQLHVVKQYEFSMVQFIRIRIKRCSFGILPVNKGDTKLFYIVLYAIHHTYVFEKKQRYTKRIYFIVYYIYC